MKNKLFEISIKMETLSIEIENVKNLVEILLNEHFDSKEKFANKHDVTFWVPYDNNFKTLTEVIFHLLSKQQMKSKELFEQFWELKNKLTEVSPQENDDSVIST